MPDKKETDSLRIVVLGSSGVGKSAIVMQYVRGVFIESYDPTLEDSFTKTISFGGHYEPINVEILDTAGTDQFAAMRDMYIGNGDVFLLVYSVDSKASFNEACSLYNRIKSIKNKKSYVMLIGNKSDLLNKFRRVTYEQGSYFAHQNRCTFAEVSARKNYGIQEAFDILVKLWLNSNGASFKKTLVTKLEDKTSLKAFKTTKRKDNRDCIIM